MALRQILMLELSDIVGPENVEDMTKGALGDLTNIELHSFVSRCK